MLIIIPVFTSFAGYIGSGFAGKTTEHVKLSAAADFLFIFGLHGEKHSPVLKETEGQQANVISAALPSLQKLQHDLKD